MQASRTFKNIIDRISEFEDSQVVSDLIFFPTDYVYSILPHSKQEDFIYCHELNGQKLTLSADPDYGLPYGSFARLLLAKITTKALQTGEKKVSLPKISAFCRELNCRVTGHTIDKIKNQALSLFTTGFCIKNTRKKNRHHGKNFYLIEDYDVWTDTTEQKQDWLSEIILSEAYYTQIERAMPLDYYGLRDLARSPLAMDVFVWLCYRLPLITESITVSPVALKAQFGCGYNDDKDGRYKFKINFEAALKLVYSIYLKANIDWDRKFGLTLEKSEPHVKRR